MKKTINVSVDVEAYAEVKLRGASISFICNEALKEFADLKKRELPISDEVLKKQLAIKSAELTELKAAMKKTKKKEKKRIIIRGGK